MDGEPSGGTNSEPSGGTNSEPSGGTNSEPSGGMDAEPTRARSRRAWVFGAGALVFGLLVTTSGLMVASISVTVQGAALTVVGAVGLVLTVGGLRPRLPRRVPLALPLGVLVLVATAVENARAGLSAWAPLGLLVGVALLSVPVRALPPVQRPTKEPSAAVVLVLIGLALMVGYEGLRHLLSPSGGELPSYLAAVGMPFAAAIGAGALAVLAATRGGVAGVAAAGALVLASAGLYMAQAAGDAWWGRQRFAETGDEAAAVLTQTLTTEAHAVAVSYGTFGAESVAATTLVIVGLVLTVVGWWWAAARRAAG